MVSGNTPPRFNATALLCKAYPRRASYFKRVGPIARITPRPVAVADAVTRTVVGQMLSGAAARTIYARLVERAADDGHGAAWRLDEAAMRDCGMSRSKTRCVTEFRDRYLADPEPIDSWPKLPVGQLYKEVDSFWGMSHWTASIIGLSYFGNENIFPATDGSLQKAIRLLGDQYPPERKLRSLTIDPRRCAPYQSYLALALWRGLDNGLFKSPAKTKK